MKTAVAGTWGVLGAAQAKDDVDVIQIYALILRIFKVNPTNRSLPAFRDSGCLDLV